jgi:hypothetical protein
MYTGGGDYICFEDAIVWYSWVDIYICKNSLKDIKGETRSHKSKKYRHYNGQKKKDKRTNNDVQNITYKTKD